MTFRPSEAEASASEVTVDPLDVENLLLPGVEGFAALRSRSGRDRAAQWRAEIAPSQSV